MSTFTAHFLYVKNSQMFSSYVKFGKVNKSTVKAVFAIYKKSVKHDANTKFTGVQKRTKPSKCKKLRHLDTCCLWSKSTLSPHIYRCSNILQICSYTLHLLHEQIQSKNGLYRLCISSESKENMTIAFGAKMSKVVQMYSLPHICYSTVCSTNVYFRHTFTASENTFQMCSFTLHLPVLANSK